MGTASTLGRGVASLIRTVHGKTPQVHPSCFISEACYITGDVEIGENSSVWPGAVIRGDYGKITIGRRTVIQDTCVIHTDDYLEIGDNVLVTHGAVIHGHRVGSNVLVGVNAVVLEEAEIGSYCILGAGTVVRGGFKVPDNSLVLGVPGQVRPLPEELRKRVEDPTEVYMPNAEAYKKAGLGTELR